MSALDQADLIVFVVLLSAVVFVTYWDLRTHLIPDFITLPGIVLGLVLNVVLRPSHIWQSIAGLLLGLGVPWTIAWLYERKRHREGLGFGAVKLMGMIGAFIGGMAVLVVMAVALLLAALAALSAKPRPRELELAPFLLIGVIVTGVLSYLSVL